MSDPALEHQAIESFARESIRDRLLYFVGKPKRRPELLRALHTSDFLDATTLIPLSELAGGAREAAVEAVDKQMRRLGASNDCYAISMISTLDGRTLPLGAALGQCFMNTVGTLLFDPLSKIGYFEGGHPNDRFILRATSGRSNAL